MGYVVNAMWTAYEGSERLVVEELGELAPLSREEPGCQSYVAYQDRERPQTFHLFEIYDDQDAFNTHTRSEHFQRLATGKAIPVLKCNKVMFFQTLDA